MSAAVTPPAERDADSLAPGQVIGRYTIVRRLAVGGMAEIFLARASGLHGFEKQVVIKRILPHHTFNRDFVSMFLDEARITATLHHPNIAQVYDIGEDSVSFFFAMEHVEGKDLRHLLKAHRRSRTAVPLKFAIAVVLGAAAGLHAAHDKRDGNGRPLNIVHRDASPSNILLGFDGSVKLIDFGIVKAEGRRTATRTGIVKGKYAYMSPEQCRGDELDRRSDVFTMGIVLFELTTGRRLFATKNEYETMRKILKDPLPRPTEIVRGYPAELERIVLRALARDRDERYPDMQELFNDLQEFAQHQRLMVSQYDLAAYMADLFPKDVPSDLSVPRPESLSDGSGERRTLVGVGARGDSQSEHSEPRGRARSPRGSSRPSDRVAVPITDATRRGAGRRFSTQDPTFDLGDDRRKERFLRGPHSRPTLKIRKAGRVERSVSLSGVVDTDESKAVSTLGDRPLSPELEAILNGDGSLGSVSKQELESLRAESEASARAVPALGMKDKRAAVIRKLTAQPASEPSVSRMAALDPTPRLDDGADHGASFLRTAVLAALFGIFTVGGWVFATGDWSAPGRDVAGNDEGKRERRRGEALKPLDSGVFEPEAAPDSKVDDSEATPAKKTAPVSAAKAAIASKPAKAVGERDDDADDEAEQQSAADKRRARRRRIAAQRQAAAERARLRAGRAADARDASAGARDADEVEAEDEGVDAERAGDEVGSGADGRAATGEDVETDFSDEPAPDSKREPEPEEPTGDVEVFEDDDSIEEFTDDE